MTEDFTFLFLTGWYPMRGQQPSRKDLFLIWNKKDNEAIYYGNEGPSHSWCLTRQPFSNSMERYDPCQWNEVPEKLITEFLELVYRKVSQ